MQVERNFIAIKNVRNLRNSSQKGTFNTAATSYIVGVGYAKVRDYDKGSYYFISLLIDIGNDVNSPYIDESGSIDPIIRAGFIISLFHGKGYRFN